MSSNSKVNSYHQPSDPDDDSDFLCGIGCFRFPFLQRFARASGFTAAFILPVFASQTLSAYINSQIPTLEKQFGLSSYESGIIMTFNDFGFLLIGLLVASIPNLVHIPRWLFSSMLVFAISGFLCSLPHFIIQEDEGSGMLFNKKIVNQSESAKEYPLCSFQNKTDDDGKQIEKSSFASINISPALKSLSIGLIAIGMIFQGGAKSVRTPFLTVYLDRENKQKTGYFLGILTSAAIFGPAISYAVGGLFSQIYVTLEDVDMSTKDPRWIGAWWLGFFVFGIFALIVSFPILCFPRRLREKQSDSKDPEEDKIIINEKEDNEKIPTSSFGVFKERAMSYVRVLKNPVFICMVLAVVMHMSSVLGPVAFKSKYIAAQFGIPLWKANLVISGLLSFTVCVGTFCGGLITKKFNFTPRMLLSLVMVLHLGQVIFHGGLIFVGCSQPEIIGPEKTVPSMNNFTQSCHCDAEDFFPVCGMNNVNYFSPCYAGCTDITRNGRIYKNCTIIPGGEAYSGLCPFDCNTLIPYLVLNALGYICGSLKIMPLFICTIRSVEDRDKSTAAGLKSVLVSVLAFIPAPIVFGLVIDTTCLVWNTNSKRKGACSLYNIEDLRYGMFSTVLIYKASALIFFGLALWQVWKIKHWKELTEKKSHATNKSLKNGII